MAGTFNIDWDEDSDKLILTYSDRAAPENNAVLDKFQEQTSYSVWLCNVQEGELRVYLAEQERTGDLEWQGQTAYWQLNFGNYVGMSALRIVLDGAEILNLPIIVSSKKMEYEKDYQKMLDKISAQLAALIFAFDAPTAAHMAPQTTDSHIAYLDYLFLRDLMRAEKLPRHFALVAHDPERRTEREAIWADIVQARQLTPATVEAMFAYPERLVRPRRAVAPMVQRALRGYTPREVRDTRVVITWDTPANRFVKHFLRVVELKLYELRAIFRREAARFNAGENIWAQRSAELARECAVWERGVTNMRRAPFLEEVGEMHVFPASNQVLLKREGYRELRDYYAKFLLTGKVRWDGLADLIRAPNKDCATLYEYWVFFKLIEIIAKVWGTRLTAGDFIRTAGEVFQVNLRKGDQSRATFSTATLYYNRSYTRHNKGVYSRSLCPDYVLEFDDYAVVFDAKYKYERIRDIVNDRATYKAQDLYKMHTYRDAIKKARAVFVLYPGNQVVCFGVEGKMWKSGELEELPRDFAGVGAIPLRIDDDSALCEVLARLLGDAN